MAQKVRMLHYTWQERLARDKPFSLLGTLISEEENEVLCIHLLVLYSQHFIFFLTYAWAQKVRKLHYTRQERLARDKPSSLLGTFVK
jgi:hypothetical protein